MTDIYAKTTLSNHFYSNKNEEKDIKTPVILRAGDRIIHSLKEMQELLTPEILLQHHVTGNLRLWLEQQFYEKEAAEISKIKIDEPGCLSKLCSILNITYDKTISDEDKIELEKRKEKIRLLTDNEEIISLPEATAFHQGELVELLNKNFKKIYLCEEEFSLPIKIPNVEYVGVGNATIRNPYTTEQYKKMGISITGIPLTDKIDSVAESIAKEAAQANGYDDFSEKHTSLAGLFHQKLHIEQRPTHYRLVLDTWAATKQYSSKHDCQKAIEALIKKAYDQAESYITVGNPKSISKEMTNFYSEHLHEMIDPHMERLQQIATMSKTQSAYEDLKKLIDDSYTFFLNIFEKELRENCDYYHMYKKQYFIDMVDIAEYDARTYDSGIWGGLEKILTDKIKYGISFNIGISIQELQKDLNDHCGTFLKAAHKEYCNYIAEIESILDSIGKSLPESLPDECIREYLTRSCAKLAL